MSTLSSLFTFKQQWCHFHQVTCYNRKNECSGAIEEGIGKNVAVASAKHTLTTQAYFSIMLTKQKRTRSTLITIPFCTIAYRQLTSGSLNYNNKYNSNKFAIYFHISRCHVISKPPCSFAHFVKQAESRKRVR